MEWLNYHHLYYFWCIAREGGVSRAAERLHLTHSTLSAQLGALESFLGAELFERRGRRLSLSPFGEQVAAYADDIFHIGAELLDLARGRASGRRQPFVVGVLGAIPTAIVHGLLRPALALPQVGPLRLRQADLAPLVAELAANRLHLVLADSQPPSDLGYRVHAHELGASGIALYATAALARRYRRGFPRSLAGAPLLLPGPGTSLRRGLERWLRERGLQPQLVGELDNAALLRQFGVAGHGLFPVRLLQRLEMEHQHGLRLVGTLPGLRERYYAIAIERRVRHPGTAAVLRGPRRAAPALRRRPAAAARP